MEAKDFAREALAWFFRRSDQAGKLYCASCLAEQLTHRARGAYPRSAVDTIVAEVFASPLPLRAASRGPCSVCRKARHCIGTASLGR